MTLITKNTQKPKIKWFWYVIAAAAIVITLLVIFNFNWIKSLFSQSKTETISQVEQSEITANFEPVAESNKIHFVAMGDMIAHDTITANAKTDTGYDYAKYFANIKGLYQDADIIYCNQESLSAGEDFGISGYPTFNAPTKFAADLASSGCNLINLANNHMGDKGTSAIDRTLDVWSELKPYATSGANKSADDQNIVAYFTVNNIKFSFLAFADFNNNSNTPSYAINIYHNQNLVQKLVNEARLNSDFVIVSAHWGVEDSSDVSNDQRQFVDLLASLNVDLVIGTGPHVLQTVANVNRADGKQMLVWYSLGNMLSSQLKLDELTGGIAMLDIEKNTDNNIVISNLKFVPTYMSYEWTSAEAANGDLLARKNVMIYPLSDATEPLSKSLFDTSVEERKAYVTNTIGNLVTIQ